MKTSDSIINITKALIAAQSEMPKAKKDSDNPYFSSKYADLAEIIDVSRPILAKHGLAIVQFPSTSIADGKVTVVLTSRILHESGEWLEDSLALLPVKSDPQAMGSCISYARRYSWQSICGIAAEDDDSNSASGLSGKSPAQQAYDQKKAANTPPPAPPAFTQQPTSQTPPQAPAQNALAPQAPPPQQPPANIPAPDAGFTETKQALINKIVDIVTKLGVVEPAQMKALASEAFATPAPKSLKMMSVDELDNFLAFVTGKLASTPSVPGGAPTF